MIETPDPGIKLMRVERTVRPAASRLKMIMVSDGLALNAIMTTSHGANNAVSVRPSKKAKRRV